MLPNRCPTRVWNRFMRNQIALRLHSKVGFGVGGLGHGRSVLGCSESAHSLILGELGIGEDGLYLHQVVAHRGPSADGVMGAESRVDGAVLVERGVLTSHQAGALAELVEE